MSKGKRLKLKGQAKRQNPIAGQSGLAARTEPDTFCVSLKHFDGSQGQKFGEWERDQLLAKLLERWRSHIGNVFYLVFLDRDHKFWPTQKRNT